MTRDTFNQLHDTTGYETLNGYSPDQLPRYPAVPLDHLDLDAINRLLAAIDTIRD